MKKTTVDSVTRIFQQALEYGLKKRKKGAYLYINTREKELAVRNVARELTVGGVPTGVLVWDNHLYKIEPVFDGDQYITEEIRWLGAMKNQNITAEPISPDLF